MSTVVRFSPTPLAAALAALCFNAVPALAADKTLGEVAVGAQSEKQAKALLRDEIIATESLSASSIERTGASMLTEALDKQPGISLQTECSICNVRNVVLNNLPGRFTTLMIDGIPIFSSVSSAYGLDSVGLYGLERIDISRGAGASLIAPEALAGVVNLVTKRPREDQAELTQTIGDYGSRRTDAYLAKDLGNQALTLSYNHNEHDSVDGDGNRISEYTGFKRDLVGLGWFADDVGGFRVKARLDVVDEERGGGAMGSNYAGIKSSASGNPFDWSQGKNGSPSSSGWINPATGLVVPYTGGLGSMSEIIFTERNQFVASGERALGAGKLRLAFGYAKHKQDSFYETDIYKAEQTQTYYEASYQQPFGDTLLTLGANYRYEDLKSTGMGNGGTTPNDGIDNYKYRTPGLFLQAYHPFMDGKLEANGSVRFDKHNEFGSIVSPRLNLLYHHTDHLNSRIAVGKGFRAPTSFFEQDHGILNTVAVVRNISEPEISHNLSYTLAFSDDRWAWTGGFNWNRIKNMAMLDPDQVNGAGQPITLFTSARNPVTVKGLDFTATYKALPTLDLTAGAEMFRYAFDPGTLAFARPEERVYLRADWDIGGWTLFARSTWTGPMDLKRFYDYENNPRYNFDGTRKMDQSPSYWVSDVRAEYRFNKRVATFVGVDNLFDFKQSDHESMLWVDGNGGIDVTQIWGPNRGRYVYAGIKLSL